MSLTDYLHGVQFIRDPINPIPVIFPRSSVIGLVGTAPVHLTNTPGNVNQLQLVNSTRKAAQLFGAKIPGFTMPYAFDAIYSQQVGLVLAVNVFNPEKATHRIAIAAASHTFDAQNTITLPDKYWWNMVVKNSGETVTYVAGTDYKLDPYAGTITRVATGSIANLAAVKVSYYKPNPAGITLAEVAGAIDPLSGLRSGIELLEESFSTFGFHPRVLIAPGYNSGNLVANKLGIVAERVHGHAILDAALGSTLEDAISARNLNASSPTTTFATSSSRVILTYPHVVDAEGLIQPYSPFLAGIIARTDAEFGYWHSPSNKSINGVYGTETKLTTSHTDPNTDIQLLNASGICTVYGAFSSSSFGAGFRAWGNRSAAYPSITSPENFIVAQRIEDQLRMALELAMLQYLDRPIGNVLIATIIQTVKSFIRVQKSIGALVNGDCWFDPEDNPAEEISNGHLVFRLSFIGPPPLEKITFRARHEIKYLENLVNPRVLAAGGVTSVSTDNPYAVAR
jgi:uncharacterized protein